MVTALKDMLKSVVSGILLGLFLAAIFAAGFFVRDAVSASRSQTQGDIASYEMLDEVQAILDVSYLRPQPDAKTREYSAIKGLLASLGDRNTFFIDPPVTASEQDVLSGTYGGIGVMIRRNETGNVILTPFDGGPAQKAGIVDGVRLVAINDVDVTLSDSLDQLDQSMRGEVRENNGVAIRVEEAGATISDYFIPFDVINVPSILWRVLDEDPAIGYIQLMRFTERTPTELDEALQDLTNQKVEAIVLDLRNNGGGLLSQSVDVAGTFISEGVIAYERDQGDEISYATEKGGAGEELPMVVLVNQGTASAAEIVAGAIQDYQRGLVIGQKTYGKGTMQRIYKLSDDSSIHVTFAEWLTPQRRSIDSSGIMPDVEMIPDENGRDVELGEAVRSLEALRTQEVTSNGG